MGRNQTINKPIELDEHTGELIVRGPNGRFLPGTRSPKPITHDNAREMQRKGVIAKRAVVASAANREVLDTELLDEYGDMAWVADSAISMMRLATAPESGKAGVMAAEWLVTNAGMGEKQAQQETSQDAAPVTQALIMLLDAVTRRLSEPVIDVIPMRNEIGIDSE